MKGALWIAQVEVTDPAVYAQYAAIAGEVIPAHGGVFLARGGAYRQMEGTGRARNVVVRFPSLAAAVACYESARYREALAFAGVSAVRDLVIVEEV